MADRRIDLKPSGARASSALRTRATRLIAAALALQLLVLTATGTWLWFRYVPAAEHAARSIHQVMAMTAAMTAVAWCVLVFVQTRSPRLVRRVLGVAIAVAIPVTAVTGRLLPWDGLAMWRVPVGTEIRGFRWLFSLGDDVRFVLIGSTEVVPTTVRRIAITHAGLGLALSVVVVLIAAVPVLDRRRARPGGPLPLPSHHHDAVSSEGSPSH